ncbi:hypothetical protein BDQ12DRAFT_694850 [Crucibulum laeve]|uniref:DNA polymerase kappa n=1 Tax=Crucibulum laeve TaxID=68775 RepID=A0A5C3MHD6_9AGAR|nr:hypothetical protein BDQ12DRAFT_694850 [Crucibulum laeve]
MQPSQESASLVKRLAGPSSGKAGLAKDQSEINRIIAEVSKGSKFYENEKKKDKELTQRINKILKERDDALQGVDLRKVELVADQLLQELESQRDLTQMIVHVDMDAFYASVELLHNPDLADKPFAVGLGVLTTASYNARQYGVRSGMATFVAKKLCPELIVIPNTFSRYSDMSDKVMDIFHRYDPTMQPAGCDEGYLNITPYCEEHCMTAEECVQQMRQAVFEETKLTVSAGIAPNKNKPNGQFMLPFQRQTIVEFMHDLSIRKIPGIGRVNERLLESIGVKTCGDIFTHRATISLMDKRFGLRFLLRTYLGIASNNVQPHEREERKSIGAERTFSPLGDKEKILKKLHEVSVELESDMKSNSWTGRTITLKYKLDTYQVFTRAKSFTRWIYTQEDLYAIGKELLLSELPLKLRLIGLRVTKLRDLRAPSPSAGGIKRAKFSHGSHELEDDLEDQEVNDEAMPGFHEHDESEPFPSQDMDLEPEIEEIDDPYDNGSEQLPVASSSTVKPQSARAATNKPKEEIRRRPRSNTETGPSVTAVTKALPTSVTESHDCPICEKTLQTDNQGLNAHIDFCLSKGAIRDAQIEASSPARNKFSKGWDWMKPTTTQDTKKTKQPLVKLKGNTKGGK